MPIVTRGNFNTSFDLSNLKKKDFGYEYPFDLNLKPGEQTHDKLRDRVLNLALESRNIMVRRFGSWREIDRTMTAYIPISEKEKQLRRNDPRKPISIVVPLNYAAKEILLTYMTAAFIEFPFFKYDGIGPEDIAKAILMEHHISYQVRRKSLGLNMHTMWQDAYKYGIGPMTVEWRRDVRKVRRPVIKEGGLLRRRRVEVEANEKVLYEGNVFYNIDPYEFMPDPNFPSYDTESHEFDAWFERFNMQKLLDLETSMPDDFFNVKYLEFIDGRSSLLRFETDDRGKKTQIDKNSSATIYTKPVDVIVAYVDLVPKAWDLGDDTSPETWVFKIAGDEIIIDAGPTNLSHGMKPVVCCAPDFDGHSISPVSRMELGYGLNEAVNFLYNGHITNVRKLINNMLIVDPGLANYNDVVNTREGAVIRMRKAVWGLGKIGDAVAQIPIQDITANNMADISAIKTLAEQVLGTPDIVSGRVSQKKERVSSAETRAAGQAALSRLEKDAKIIFMQAHNPLAIMMAEHTAQNITEERWVKIIGTLEEKIEKELKLKEGRAKITPDTFEDFAVDVLPSDGTIPGSHRDPQTLIQFFQSLSALPPEQLVRFDLVNIVKTIARRNGIKEVDNWESGQQAIPPVQAQVLPDEEVARQAQAGNIAPIGELQ